MPYLIRLVHDLSTVSIHEFRDKKKRQDQKILRRREEGIEKEMIRKERGACTSAEVIRVGEG